MCFFRTGGRRQEDEIETYLKFHKREEIAYLVFRFDDVSCVYRVNFCGIFQHFYFDYFVDLL
jgi:hypothetical protein